jgi:hypothetical protein
MEYMMDIYENYVTFLRFEVGILKSRLKPEDTGHIHTTIRVLEERIQEIEDNKKNEKILTAYSDYQVHSLS